MVANNRDEIINSFYTSLPSDITDDEFVKRVKSIHNIEEREVIAQSVCDKAIDDLSLWYGWNYPDDCKLSNDYVIKTLFKPLIQYIKKKKQSYYEAVSLFFDGDFSKSFELLKLEIDGYIKDGSVIDETWFAYGYPFLSSFLISKITFIKYYKPRLIACHRIHFRISAAKRSSRIYNFYNGIHQFKVCGDKAPCLSHMTGEPLYLFHIAVIHVSSCYEIQNLTLQTCKVS